ncbi:MAG: gamma-glutamyl-gamma-aminobutyrate hydrolase family protein [Gammaproteobacteria bacterium]|nr:gamma-glutamyl-gamma-aminobutyrate hydrolase family protein [Pseudomonadales bacterium]MCP5348874.1 gamma-glutamyl-gamma-aminobutyrate hydrolase family protein [Pseudomonadales bacterium]
MAETIRIGVTGNSRRVSPSWLCTAMALRLAGATPDRISVRHDPGHTDFQALVIGGGDDVSPEHYGHDITEKVKPDPERDRLEIDWIRRALSNRIPLLGICRGAQLINVVLGGTLYQDIRPLRNHTYNRPGLLPTKQILLQADSLVAKVCGRQRLRVNSLHNQAIHELGEGLQTVGMDLDDIVQAVEYHRGPAIIGVQWHPEYLLYLPSQLALFRWLVEEAR